jgi:hypothetical protein
MRKWIRRTVIISCLLLTPIAFTGCMDVFKTQSEKDAVVTQLETQVNDQQSTISTLTGKLEQMALDTADAQNLTEEERARLVADMNSIVTRIEEAQTKYGPLLDALATAQSKPTAGEALGDIGSAASALLPYPFNIFGGMAASLLVGAGATKRRKDNQLTAVVESVSEGWDGNGNLDMTKVAKAQKSAGVQTLVDKILRNIEVQRVKNG